MKKQISKKPKQVVKTYRWLKNHVDGKVTEKILGAAHPGCCKQ